MPILRHFCLLFAILVVSFSTQAAEPTEQARRLASQLLFDVPYNSKVALRLFYENETGLPAEVASKLYDDIYNALFMASGGRHQFVERKNLLALLKSREEFYETNPEALLKEAKADVEIICDPTPGGVDGMVLSCSAADLRTALTLGRAQVTVPIAIKGQTALPLDIAIANLASDITNKIDDLSLINAAVIRDQNYGVQTDLSVLLGNMLSPAIEAKTIKNYRLALKRYGRDKELSDTAIEPKYPDVAYRLEGIIWHVDDVSIQLQAALVIDGKTHASGNALITKSSLPDSATADNSLSEKIYTAIGTAIISDKLDYNSAWRAAKNLARARIVAQATGTKSPAIKVIHTEIDAALALTQTLTHGIPVEERFINLQADDDANKITVELHARVLPVGNIVAPDLQARLSKPVYKSMEPILIKITSSAQAYIGIFAWSSDNQVVRIYPNHLNADLIVDPRNALLLPNVGDGELMSMPLPIEGNNEDHEAIIVIAATSSQPFETLAKMAGENLAQTLEASKSGSRFFNALGELDLSRMSVHILPYQVTN